MSLVQILINTVFMILITYAGYQLGKSYVDRNPAQPKAYVCECK